MIVLIFLSSMSSSQNFQHDKLTHVDYSTCPNYIVTYIYIYRYTYNIWLQSAHNSIKPYSLMQLQHAKLYSSNNKLQNRVHKNKRVMKRDPASALTFLCRTEDKCLILVVSCATAKQSENRIRDDKSRFNGDSM